MNPRVTRYLNKAEECERFAAQAGDPDVKAALVEISQQWRKLARQVEQLELGCHNESSPRHMSGAEYARWARMTRTKLKGIMGHIVEITLEEHSTADNQPKTFPTQTVEIVHDTDTVSNGVDGRISIGRHPSKTLWVEGSATDLANITNVKITGNNGALLAL